MMAKWVVLVVLLLLMTVCYAQETHGRFTGVVQAEGKAVPNATIFFNKVQQLSDTIGRFDFSFHMPGMYTVKVTMVGYEPFLKKFSISSDTSVIIDLEKAVTALNEVVVTGTLRPVQKLQSPISVEVYTPQFFKKNPTPSIFEALQ